MTVEKAVCENIPRYINPPTARREYDQFRLHSVHSEQIGQWGSHNMISLYARFTDIDNASIEAEINAITEEDVSAAFPQLRDEELSSDSEEGREEDVLDPLPGMTAPSGKRIVTIEDELDPTNRDSMPKFEMPRPGIHAEPYRTGPSGGRGENLRF